MRKPRSSGTPTHQERSEITGADPEQGRGEGPEEDKRIAHAAAPGIAEKRGRAQKPRGKFGGTRRNR